MAALVKVYHRAKHARGVRVAGLGHEYYVNVATGKLHIINRHKRVEPEPGIRPACAEYLIRRSRYIAKCPPDPPDPPAPPPPAPRLGDNLPSPSAPPPPPQDPTAVLSGNLKSIRAALATGEYDQHLDQLQAAEEADKRRSGALSAIRDRRTPQEG